MTAPRLSLSLSLPRPPEETKLFYPFQRKSAKINNYENQKHTHAHNNIQHSYEYSLTTITIITITCVLNHYSRLQIYYPFNSTYEGSSSPDYSRPESHPSHSHSHYPLCPSPLNPAHSPALAPVQSGWFDLTRLDSSSISRSRTRSHPTRGAP